MHVHIYIHAAYIYIYIYIYIQGYYLNFLDICKLFMEKEP